MSRTLLALEIGKFKGVAVLPGDFLAVGGVCRWANGDVLLHLYVGQLAVAALGARCEAGELFYRGLAYGVGVVAELGGVAVGTKYGRSAGNVIFGDAEETAV